MVSFLSEFLVTPFFPLFLLPKKFLLPCHFCKEHLAKRQNHNHDIKQCLKSFFRRRSENMHWGWIHLSFSCPNAHPRQINPAQAGGGRSGGGDINMHVWFRYLGHHYLKYHYFWGITIFGMLLLLNHLRLFWDINSTIKIRAKLHHQGSAISRQSNLQLYIFHWCCWISNDVVQFPVPEERWGQVFLVTQGVSSPVKTLPGAPLYSLWIFHPAVWVFSDVCVCTFLRIHRCTQLTQDKRNQPAQLPKITLL